MRRVTVIEWNRSAPLATVRSERVGTVRREYTGHRSGDHLLDGLLTMRPGDAPPPALPPAVPITEIGRLCRAQLRPAYAFGSAFVSRGS